MVAYSFRRRFAEAVAEGRKTQTIRGPRRRHARPGEEVQLYFGMRTRHCRLLRRGSCLSVEPAAITCGPAGIVMLTVDGRPLSDDALGAFARADGFNDLADMSAFWLDLYLGWLKSTGEADRPVQHAIWEGFLIRWQPL